MKIVLGIVIGAAIGAAVGYFGKCASGTCPMTSNPYISAVIGAILGGMLAAGK